MESINRGISWENKPKVAIKKAMAGLRRSAEVHKFVNNKIKSWSDDVPGIRPGEKIKAVERNAVDHLIRKEKKKSNVNKIRNPPGTKHDFVAVTPEDVLHATNKGDDATYIDPITNRRISKNTMAKLNAQFERLGRHKSSDLSFTAAETDPKSKYNDLDKYEPTNDGNIEESHDGLKYDDLNEYEPVLDERPARDQSSEYEDLDKYNGPVRHNEPDGLPELTPEEDSKKYDDLNKYSATQFDSSSTQSALTPEEQSKLYDDLKQYNSVFWNEPNGLRTQTIEELSKNYDDLHQYGAVRWKEPNGLCELTAEELSKNYNDLGSYGPVVWSEPNGLRRTTPEEESKKYEDLATYDSPFEASMEKIEAHAASQNDRTMRGKPLAPKVEAPVEDFFSKYEDLHLYGAVRWNEPDGLRDLTPEELSKKYADLHLYGAVRWNEPNGQRKSTPEEQSKQYKNTSLYGACDLFWPEIIPNIVHHEEASKQYADLPKYEAFENDGPTTEQVHREQASKQYKDLSKYPTAGYEEIDPSQSMHPEELSKNYTDLGSYKPTDFISQAQAYPSHPEEASKVYQDLGMYTAVRNNEPNGTVTLPPDEVARSLKEFKSKAGFQDTVDGPFAYHHTQNRSSRALNNTENDTVELLTSEEIRAATLRRAQDLGLQDEVSEAESVKTSRPGANTEEIKNEGPELASMDESFPIESEAPVDHKPHSALGRDNKDLKDPYSHKPVGLETSYSEECGRTTTPVMMKHYKSKQLSKPLSYKILAYDPASQSMSIAEAASSVHDEGSAIGLSDALLQLSNPAKFLPYFNTLEAQGYEIVAGSGEVLIFRKVRQSLTSDEVTSDMQVKSTRINPVDLMGKPAVGNFASPTGFVNYDSVSEPLTKPAPPVEPRTDEDAGSAQIPAKQRKKRRLGRKLAIGTAGVAGSAYVAAVIAEYFSTKGLDSERPKTRRL